MNEWMNNINTMKAKRKEKWGLKIILMWYH